MSVRPFHQSVNGQHLIDEIVPLLSDETIVRAYLMVAFATIDGVLLLGPRPGGALYGYLARGGNLNITIGVDAITTDDALRALRDLTEIFPDQANLVVYESQDNTLFHVKLYIFERADGSGVAIVGSNNLTRGGLVTNTEYAARHDASAAELERYISDFGNIAASASADVTEELLSRIAARRSAGIAAIRTAASQAHMTAESDGETQSRVLVQVVPRSGDRPSQVGIAKDAMIEFFGLAPGIERTIQLQNVPVMGSPGPYEDRRLVRSEVNLNSRIEVGALSGRQYPSTGRPIAIFQEVGTSLYRYMVLMPGDEGHEELWGYLSSLPRGRSLQHEIMLLGKLLSLWPGYPM